MAVILKTSYSQNIAGLAEPILYVDTINKDSFIAEMYNYCVRYIREHTEELSISDEIEIKRSKFSAKNEQEIKDEKKDGFWIVGDEKNKIVTLFKRITCPGRLYGTYPYVITVFTLTYKECPKIVPQVFKKSSLYDNFTSELADRVTQFRNRTDNPV